MSRLIFSGGFKEVSTFTFVDSRLKPQRKKDSPKTVLQYVMRLISISLDILIDYGCQVIGVGNEPNDIGVIVEEVISPSAGKNQKVILRRI